MPDTSHDPSEVRVVATLTASPPRRYLGTAMLGMLGFLMLYLSISVPSGGAQFLLIAFGLLGIYASYRLFDATSQIIELTTQELRLQSGTVLAELSNIQKVERGAFAFKPSNGFLVTLKESGPRRWAPGLFWSFSRQLGVGGVTGAPQSKGMAEAIAILVAERDIAAQQKQNEE